MRPAALESAHKGLSDVEIARRVAAGDQGALRLLMRRHNQMLYRAARSILKAEAEDAVHEAHPRAPARCARNVMYLTAAAAAWAFAARY